MEIAQNYDYMAVIETKIDDSVTSSALTIKGYSLQRQDRNVNGGGVLAYIKESYQPVALEEIQEKHTKKGLEMTATKITVKGPMKHIVL